VPPWPWSSASALNLNVHIHALVLDGVFARDAAGVVVFHPARCISTLDVAEVLAAVEPLDQPPCRTAGARAERGCSSDSICRVLIDENLYACDGAHRRSIERHGDAGLCEGTQVVVGE
jgi:hypothetical protein